MKTQVVLSRKEFLKAAGLSLVGMLVVPFLTAAGKSPPNKQPPQKSALSVKGGSVRQNGLVWYQGTPDGKVLKSEDGGISWKILANFSESCSVDQVTQTADSLLAQLTYSGAKFSLRSSDGRVWFTT